LLDDLFERDALATSLGGKARAKFVGICFFARLESFGDSVGTFPEQLLPCSEAINPRWVSRKRSTLAKFGTFIIFAERSRGATATWARLLEMCA
jgi:hypothetical protein